MNANTRPSRFASPKVEKIFALQNANATPKTPPSTASTRLSVTTSLTTRHRLAPSAVRTAISFWRDAAFASSRFATFAQAINRTNPTAPRSIRRVGFTLPVISSCKGTARALHFSFPFGYSGDKRCLMAFSSAFACSTDTPA